jgi:hypothetical protein
MRLTPRSAVALADTELLRVARTEPLPSGTGQPRLADRLRSLVLRITRSEDAA